MKDNIKNLFLFVIIFLPTILVAQNNKTSNERQANAHQTMNELMENINKLKALEGQKQPQLSKPKTKYDWKTADDGFKWLPFDDDGYIGVKNSDEQVIVPAFYNKIEYYHGFFIAKDRVDVYAVYRNTGELIIGASDVITVNINKQNKKSPFVLFTNKGKWLVINQDGHVILPADYYTFVYSLGTENDGYLRVGKNGYQGILDMEGNFIIPLNKYNRVERHKSSSGDVTYSFGIYGNNVCSGVCDSKGKELIRTNYYETVLERDYSGKSFYKVMIGNQFGKLDLEGNPVFLPSNPKNKQISVQLGGRHFSLVLTPQGRMGVNNPFSGMVIPTEFDNIVPGKNHFLVVKGCYMGAYDTNGKCIIKPNKYFSLAEMKYYFSATSADGLGTAIDSRGREMEQLKYCNIMPIINRTDTILAVRSKEDYLFAIFSVKNGRNKQITPFKYDDLNFLNDNITSKAIGYLVFQKGRVGACKLDGTEFIEPIFTDMEVVGIKSKILKVKNGNKCGAYKLDGTVIVYPQLFDNIIYLEDDNRIVATNPSRKCTFDMNGNLLVDTRPNAQRDKYITMADEEFEKANYTTAADYYGKAIVIEPSATLYYNRGISYYNNKKWNKAIDDFDNCLKLNPSQELIDGSRALICKARSLQAQKKERQRNIASDIFQTVLYVANAYIQQKAQPKMQTKANLDGLDKGGFVRDKRYDYLLDPNYAIQRVQIENWNEYLYMTNGGKTMSYDEWFLLKGQMLLDAKSAGIDDDKPSSDRSSSTSNQSSRKRYVKDCRLCHALGKCWTCNGKGYYYQMGSTLVCPNCPNHNGLCPSCGGTGKMH